MSESKEIEILLKQHDTAWDALKLWANEINKLIYWMALMFASGIALFAQKLLLFLPILSSSAIIWLYLYKRAVLWYKINLVYLNKIKFMINSYYPDLYIYDKLHSLEDKRTSIFSDHRFAVLVSGIFILYFFYLFICLLPDKTAIVGIERVSNILWVIVAVLYVSVSTLVRTRVSWKSKIKIDSIKPPLFSKESDTK
jgi:hypothetical protein